jgi:hypothetical protein
MSIGGGVWSAAVDESSCMSWVVCVGDRWYRLVGRVGNVYGAIWLEVSGWLHDCINELKMRLECLEGLWDALRHEIKSWRCVPYTPGGGNDTAATGHRRCFQNASPGKHCR